MRNQQWSQWKTRLVNSIMFHRELWSYEGARECVRETYRESYWLCGQKHNAYQLVWSQHSHTNCEVTNSLWSPDRQLIWNVHHLKYSSTPKLKLCNYFFLYYFFVVFHAIIINECGQSYRCVSKFHFFFKSSHFNRNVIGSLEWGRKIVIVYIVI